MAWEIEEAEGFAPKYRRYSRKYPAATVQALENLQAYLEALRDGTPVLQITGVRIRSEGQGVVAFDESGGARNMRLTRLYAYPEAEAETLWVITIGDKETQSRRDLPDCREFMRDLKRRRGQQDG